MKFERRFRWAVFCACLLHAAILALAFSYPERAQRGIDLSLTESPPITQIDLRLERLPGDTRTALHAGSSEEQASSSRSIHAHAPLEPRGGHNTTSEVPLSASAVTSEQSTATPGGDGDSQAPTTGNSMSSGHLTLRQLGLDGNNAVAFALSREQSKEAGVKAATDRLHRSMQQGRVDDDRQLGLGVPAPLITALELAARDLAIPTNTTALFSASFDGSGSLLGFDLLQTDHASPQWGQLERRVERILNGKKLQILSNGRNVQFTLRLVARSQLPSGHDPGTAVDVLGIPVKKGQGKKSSKISVLDPRPKLLEFEIPGANGETIKVPVPGLAVSVLSLAGDPSDIGAPARHMIRVEVVNEKVY